MKNTMTNHALSMVMLLASLTFGLIVAQAQTTMRHAAPTRGQAPWITTAVSSEQVRYLAPLSVYQIRLEVFDLGGNLVYDSGPRLGNLLDWDWQNQQGDRLADDLYRCAVTVEDFSGLASQRTGVLVRAGNEALLQPDDRSPLALREANELGNVDQREKSQKANQ